MLKRNAEYLFECGKGKHDFASFYDCAFDELHERFHLHYFNYEHPNPAEVGYVSPIYQGGPAYWEETQRLNLGELNVVLTETSVPGWCAVVAINAKDQLCLRDMRYAPGRWSYDDVPFTRCVTVAQSSRSRGGNANVRSITYEDVRWEVFGEDLFEGRFERQRWIRSVDTASGPLVALFNSDLKAPWIDIDSGFEYKGRGTAKLRIEQIRKMLMTFGIDAMDPGLFHGRFSHVFDRQSFHLELENEG